MDLRLDGVNLSSLTGVRLLEWTEQPLLTAESARTEQGAACTAASARTGWRGELRVELHQPDPLQRMTAWRSLLAWAEGTRLLRSDRPGQGMSVCLTALPAFGAVAWREALTLPFANRWLPWWTDETPVTVTGQGTAWSSVVVDGVPRTVYRLAGAQALPGETGAHAALTLAAPERITQMTLTLGETQLRFHRMSVAAGVPIVLEQDTDGQLRMEAGGVSLLPCLSEDSGDSLCLPTGRCDWSVTADAAFTAQLRWRGWYR